MLNCFFTMGIVKSLPFHRRLSPRKDSLGDEKRKESVLSHMLKDACMPIAMVSATGGFTFWERVKRFSVQFWWG